MSKKHSLCYAAPMSKQENLPQIDMLGVAARVEAIRAVTGLNKETFSESFGLDPSSYSKIIGGKGKPLKSEHAYAMAVRWGVTMDFIYRGNLSRIEDDMRAKLMHALKNPHA